MKECLAIITMISGIIIFISGVAMMGTGYNLYIESIPFEDEIGTYQVHNYIPTCMFTKCFDKKIYTEYNSNKKICTE